MFSMKKKTVITALIAAMMLCTACSGKMEAESYAAEDGKEEASPVMEGTIEVAENLPDKDIIVPDYLKEEEGESVYHLNGEEQTERAREMAVQIEDSINQVLADKEYYPNVTSITVNSECTEFNVMFSSRNLSLYENVLPVSLCIVGDKFQLYQGKQENELLTIVNYVDEDSGEIFSTMNSKEIE